jgi:hypothetical protein
MPNNEQPIEGPKQPAALVSWRSRVRQALRWLGGIGTLQAIYLAVEDQYPEATQNAHWKAKVRQVLQQDPSISSFPAEASTWGFPNVSPNSQDPKQE